MPVYVIAIIEFGEIWPGGAARSPGDRGLSACRQEYCVSEAASLIPITLQDPAATYQAGWTKFWSRIPRRAAPLVADPVVVNGTPYGPRVSGGPPADPVALCDAVTTTDGDTYFTVCIAGTDVGLTGPRLPMPGQRFTLLRAARPTCPSAPRSPCAAGHARHRILPAASGRSSPRLAR